MKTTIECPFCRKEHAIIRRGSENWHGTKASEGKVFAFAWCADQGREVGDWVDENE